METHMASPAWPHTEFEDKTGLLIIRAWVEEGSSQPLRAVVRSTNDVSAGIGRTLNFARAAEVGAEVYDWLDEVVRGADQA